MATIERARRLQQPDLSPEEIELARTAQRCIVESLDRSNASAITLESTDGTVPPVKLSPAMLRLVATMLGAMSERREMVFIPSKREFSTVEAANFLNVSRPFVIKEIEAGRLACRMVGTHRRIEFEALQAYAQQMRSRQVQALQAMADEVKEMGLEY